MSRLDLNVPFAEKQEAKELGARWDAKLMTWFVPPGVDAAPFAKWATKLPNMRASSYFVASTSTCCWKCGEQTNVFCFLLPAGHETLEPVDEEDAGFGPDDEFDEANFTAWAISPESSEWVVSGLPAKIEYVEYLSPVVAARMAGISLRYRVDRSQTINSTYWINHCVSCGAKQGDNELHSFQGAFCPTSAEEASRITVSHFKEPFFAYSGTLSFGVELFESMCLID